VLGKTLAPTFWRPSDLALDLFMVQCNIIKAAVDILSFEYRKIHNLTYSSLVCFSSDCALFKRKLVNALTVNIFLRLKVLLIWNFYNKGLGFNRNTQMGFFEFLQHCTNVLILESLKLI